MALPRSIVRYAFYGALMGSLFGIWTDPHGAQRVLMTTRMCGLMPLHDVLRCTLIPMLLCTVWGVALAMRCWPLATIVGFSIGGMLIDPLLSLIHVNYPPGVNVAASASFLMVGVSVLWCCAPLRRPVGP